VGRGSADAPAVAIGPRTGLGPTGYAVLRVKDRPKSPAGASGKYEASTHRLLTLDVLRALAIVLVLGHHAFLPPTDFRPRLRFFEVWQLGGWIGVDLFFVLSGFLISGLLFREHQRFGAIRFGRFVLRRGLKLYPAFYVLFATTVAVRLYLDPPPLAPVLCELFFVQNYGPSLWGHTWSLAVEEHFYLFLPALLIVLARLRKGRKDVFAPIPAICLVVCVSLLSLRFANARFFEYGIRTHFTPTHLRADALLFGVFLSYLFHYHRERYERFCRRYFGVLVVGGIALSIPAFNYIMRDTPYLYTLGFTSLYVGSGMLLSAIVVRGLPENRVMRAIGYVGSHSYSIYLWHLPVNVWLVGGLLRGAELSRWTAWSLYMSASIVVGIVLAQMIEFPVLKVRDRFFPSRSKPLEEPAALADVHAHVAPALGDAEGAAPSSSLHEPGR